MPLSSSVYSRVVPGFNVANATEFQGALTLDPFASGSLLYNQQQQTLAGNSSRPSFLQTSNVDEPRDSTGLSLNTQSSAPVPSESIDRSTVSSFDAGPLVMGASLATKFGFDQASISEANQGRISSEIEAQNLSRTGSDASTGMAIGGVLGSTLDPFLGPLGTLGGALLGGIIGGVTGDAQARSVHTTDGDVSTTNPNLAY